MTVTTVKGETQPRDFQLLSGGSPLNGTGYTLAIVSSCPALAAVWLNQPGGTVRVTGHENAKPGRYPFRFHLTKAGESTYAPNEEGAAVWIIQKWSDVA